jgi:ABC-type transporter Mla subunit MlaD
MRNRSKEISVTLVMLLLAVLLVLAFLWALSIGTVKLSFMQFMRG